MGLTSLQVCMDSSDWLQGTIQDESGMDSSSPSGDMLTCSRPLMERRLRPQHEQPLKCPRCDSAHTKFCYYNNYSLTQPRYFCKTCRRYWTKGGTLRNIPVGGGCRKNKKVSSSSSSSTKKPSNDLHQPIHHPSHHLGSSSNNPIDLHLSNFPELQFSHLNSLYGSTLGNPSFVESKYNNGVIENPRAIDFMESKLNYDFMGNGELGMIGNGIGDMHNGNSLVPSFQGFCPPYEMSAINGSSNGANFMDTCQRLMLPYHDDGNDEQINSIDVKPNTKILALDWQQDQGCSDAGKDHSFGYLNGLGSWNNVMMNGYGPSTTNPLV